MLTKREIKRIKSLQHKKYRIEESCFVIEGYKSVNELIQSDFEIENIYISSEIENEALKSYNINIIKPSEMKAISSQKNASGILAIAKIPKFSIGQANFGKITLVLDHISDPGNLGTIIRTCDWFGITNIVCSEKTVDLYNPKVIQATMGSFTRVKVYYVNLLKFLYKNSNKNDIRILGLDMEGAPINTFSFTSEDEKIFVVVGNEANGLSEEIKRLSDERLSIPIQNLSHHKTKPESLNASIAAAISCYVLTTLK